MRLKRIVRLKWRDVSVIELDGSLDERIVGIAALTVQALAQSKGCYDFVRLVVRYKMLLDVRFFSRIGCANRIGGSFSGLERLRYGECNVLPVVADYIIFEGRPAFFADTRESRPRDRTKDLADISAMKNGLDARHFLSGRRIELCDPSISNGRSDGNAVKHSRKVKVGGVLCGPRDLAWAIHANRIAADD